MDLGVRGQGYLIIGGTAGMGYEAARALAADGAKVAIVGRDRERADAAAEVLRTETGSEVVAVVGDAAKGFAEAERIVAEAHGALGGLAGMGITTGTSNEAHSTLEDATDAIWAESFDDVMMSVVRSVKATLPYLLARGAGTLVTTSAFSIHSPHHNRMPYVTMKSAVAVFTKNLAKTYGGRGIRANCVCPGAIETGPLAELRSALAAQRGVAPEGVLEKVMVEEWHMDVALGRPGKPQEVGELMAFLLSERAGYLTGATINIDGGTDF